MPAFRGPSDIIPLADGPLDPASAALVRLAAWVAAGTEPDVRRGLDACRAAGVPDQWVEELILQSYLFAGFPRALNAAREWRARGGRAAAGTAPRAEPGYDAAGQWQARGERTCARVYGRHYEKLRHNIRALHPALDDWMIVEGYGKVLSRDGLDLGRRELCIVAACAAARQARQLHSHLLGARNAGVPDAAIAAAVEALDGAVPPAALTDARLLWQRVASARGARRVR